MHSSLERYPLSLPWDPCLIKSNELTLGLLGLDKRLVNLFNTRDLGECLVFISFTIHFQVSSHKSRIRNAYDHSIL
ncbi:hypothetical protein HanRHA438_Chr03g0101731 [Helianthus annuus]|nr:hypothetical protein HanRHA438_Chr03g0101731 [Helianthus annuus]